MLLRSIGTVLTEPLILFGRKKKIGYLGEVEQFFESGRFRVRAAAESRKSGAGRYRFGFNGKEQDNEVKGIGDQIDYGHRVYDPRIARFQSVDPLSGKYPWYTPYQFAGNGPIENSDMDGEEEFHYTIRLGHQGQTYLTQGRTEEYNHHNLFGWHFSTPIQGQRYVVNYAGNIYYIGFASNKGRNNNWKVAEFKQFLKNPDIVNFIRTFDDEQTELRNAGTSTVRLLALSYIGATAGIIGMKTQANVPVEDEIQEAANIAKGKITPGKGPVYGTKVHKEFENQINLLKQQGVNVSSEVSYLNGKVVPYGTENSVRADVVVGDINSPTAVYDLKTGGATISTTQMNNYKANLPSSVKTIEQVKPTN